MNFFFVSQRQTYREEHSQKYLWAPKDNIFHHQSMASIKKGDAIIQYNGSIVGIAIAKNDCYSAPRPSAAGFDRWGEAGYKVDVEQYHFYSHVNKDSLSTKLINCQPGYHAPLNYKGGVNQGYLFPANKEMVEIILEKAEQIDSSERQTEIIRKIREILNFMPEEKPTFILNKRNTDATVDNSEELSPEEILRRRYINSLLAKPFVILTGNSGTGKTRLATQFAKSLEKTIENKTNYLLIPVGSDWTDNTKILGYYNPLANKGEGKYEKTPIYEFIELAGQNPDVPFFLILDEMNLSHVERYFSDFLSKMELIDYKDPEKKEYFNLTENLSLEFPKNLFITGTVNIDETTYMFSPKVLDRANVIEFKPDMGSVLDNILDGSDGGVFNKYFDTPEEFLETAKVIRNGSIPENITDELNDIKNILEAFYIELEKYGFEFAYRTVKEIRLYAIANYEMLKNDSFLDSTDIADIQILQKVLPKLHGNRKQIGELLDTLENLCEDNSLSKSLEKIKQMKDKLVRFQYASFI